MGRFCETRRELGALFGRSSPYPKLTRPKAAAVHLDDLLGDSEPQTGAALGLGVRAVDLMETARRSDPVDPAVCQAQCLCGPAGARSRPFAGRITSGGGEVSIGAVRKYRLTRLKMELDTIEMYRDGIRFE